MWLSSASSPICTGAIAIFDEEGNFIQQLVAGDRLVAPWGIALVPPGFGQFAFNLLVGNFNFSFLHSEINAYNSDHRQADQDGSRFTPAVFARAVFGRSGSGSGQQRHISRGVAVSTTLLR
jgi:hypothetical protein